MRVGLLCGPRLAGHQADCAIVRNLVHFTVVCWSLNVSVRLDGPLCRPRWTRRGRAHISRGLGGDGHAGDASGVGTVVVGRPRHRHVGRLGQALPVPCPALSRLAPEVSLDIIRSRFLGRSRLLCQLESM